MLGRFSVVHLPVRDVRVWLTVRHTLHASGYLCPTPGSFAEIL